MMKIIFLFLKLLILFALINKSGCEKSKFDSKLIQQLMELLNKMNLINYTNNISSGNEPIKILDSSMVNYRKIGKISIDQDINQNKYDISPTIESQDNHDILRAYSSRPRGYKALENKKSTFGNSQQARRRISNQKVYSNSYGYKKSRKNFPHRKSRNKLNPSPDNNVYQSSMNNKDTPENSKHHGRRFFGFLRKILKSFLPKIEFSIKQNPKESKKTKSNIKLSGKQSPKESNDDEPDVNKESKNYYSELEESKQAVQDSYDQENENSDSENFEQAEPEQDTYDQETDIDSDYRRKFGSVSPSMISRAKPNLLLTNKKGSRRHVAHQKDRSKLDSFEKNLFYRNDENMNDYDYNGKIFEDNLPSMKIWKKQELQASNYDKPNSYRDPENYNLELKSKKQTAQNYYDQKIGMNSDNIGKFGDESFLMVGSRPREYKTLENKKSTLGNSQQARRRISSQKAYSNSYNNEKSKKNFPHRKSRDKLKPSQDNNTYESNINNKDIPENSKHHGRRFFSFLKKILKSFLPKIEFSIEQSPKKSKKNEPNIRFSGKQSPKESKDDEPDENKSPKESKDDEPDENEESENYDSDSEKSEQAVQDSYDQENDNSYSESLEQAEPDIYDQEIDMSSDYSRKFGSVSPSMMFRAKPNLLVTNKRRSRGHVAYEKDRSKLDSFEKKLFYRNDENMGDYDYNGEIFKDNLPSMGIWEKQKLQASNYNKPNRYRDPENYNLELKNKKQTAQNYYDQKIGMNSDSIGKFGDDSFPMAFRVKPNLLIPNNKRSSRNKFNDLEQHSSDGKDENVNDDDDIQNISGDYWNKQISQESNYDGPNRYHVPKNYYLGSKNFKQTPQKYDHGNSKGCRNNSPSMISQTKLNPFVTNTRNKASERHEAYGNSRNEFGNVFDRDGGKFGGIISFTKNLIDHSHHRLEAYGNNKGNFKQIGRKHLRPIENIDSTSEKKLEHKLPSMRYWNKQDPENNEPFRYETSRNHKNILGDPDKFEKHSDINILNNIGCNNRKSGGRFLGDDVKYDVLIKNETTKNNVRKDNDVFHNILELGKVISKLSYENFENQNMTEIISNIVELNKNIVQTIEIYGLSQANVSISEQSKKLFLDLRRNTTNIKEKPKCKEFEKRIKLFERTHTMYRNSTKNNNLNDIKELMYSYFKHLDYTNRNENIFQYKLQAVDDDMVEIIKKQRKLNAESEKLRAHTQKIFSDLTNNDEGKIGQKLKETLDSFFDVVFEDIDCSKNDSTHEKNTPESQDANIWISNVQCSIKQIDYLLQEISRQIVPGGTVFEATEKLIKELTKEIEIMKDDIKTYGSSNIDKANIITGEIEKWTRQKYNMTLQNDLSRINEMKYDKELSTEADINKKQPDKYEIKMRKKSVGDKTKLGTKVYEQKIQIMPQSTKENEKWYEKSESPLNLAAFATSSNKNDIENESIGPRNATRLNKYRDQTVKNLKNIDENKTHNDHQDKLENSKEIPKKNEHIDEDIGNTTNIVGDMIDSNRSDEFKGTKNPAQRTKYKNKKSEVTTTTVEGNLVKHKSAALKNATVGSGYKNKESKKSKIIPENATKDYKQMDQNATITINMVEGTIRDDRQDELTNPLNTMELNSYINGKVEGTSNIDKDIIDSNRLDEFKTPNSSTKQTRNRNEGAGSTTTAWDDKINNQIDESDTQEEAGETNEERNKQDKNTTYMAQSEEDDMFLAPKNGMKLNRQSNKMAKHTTNTIQDNIDNKQTADMIKAIIDNEFVISKNATKSSRQSNKTTRDRTDNDRLDELKNPEYAMNHTRYKNKEDRSKTSKNEDIIDSGQIDESATSESAREDNGQRSKKGKNMTNLVEDLADKFMTLENTTRSNKPSSKTIGNKTNIVEDIVANDRLDELKAPKNAAKYTRYKNREAKSTTSKNEDITDSDQVDESAIPNNGRGGNGQKNKKGKNKTGIAGDSKGNKFVTSKDATKRNRQSNETVGDRENIDEVIIPNDRLDELETPKNAAKHIRPGKQEARNSTSKNEDIIDSGQMDESVSPESTRGGKGQKTKKNNNSADIARDTMDESVDHTTNTTILKNEQLNKFDIPRNATETNRYKNQGVVGKTNVVEDIMDNDRIDQLIVLNDAGARNKQRNKLKNATNPVGNMKGIESEDKLSPKNATMWNKLYNRRDEDIIGKDLLVDVNIANNATEKIELENHGARNTTDILEHNIDNDRIDSISKNRPSYETENMIENDMDSNQADKSIIPIENIEWEGHEGEIFTKNGVTKMSQNFPPTGVPHKDIRKISSPEFASGKISSSERYSTEKSTLSRSIPKQRNTITEWNFSGENSPSESYSLDKISSKASDSIEEMGSSKLQSDKEITASQWYSSKKILTAFSSIDGIMTTSLYSMEKVTTPAPVKEERVPGFSFRDKITQPTYSTTEWHSEEETTRSDIISVEKMTSSEVFSGAITVKKYGSSGKFECYSITNLFEAIKTKCPKNSSSLPILKKRELLKLMCPKEIYRSKFSRQKLEDILMKFQIIEMPGATP